jgi:hypothetical protein
MFLWTCSGDVTHAVVVGSDRTACGVPIERLRIAEYDKERMPCEICEEKVRQSRNRNIQSPKEERP